MVSESDKNQRSGEENNLSSKEPEIARRLLHELIVWTKEVDAPIPTVPNPKFDLDEPLKTRGLEGSFSVLGI